MAYVTYRPTDEAVSDVRHGRIVEKTLSASRAVFKVVASAFAAAQDYKRLSHMTDAALERDDLTRSEIAERVGREHF